MKYCNNKFEQRLYKIRSICPTKEEIKLLKEAKAKNRNMGFIDKFVLWLSQIPDARQRVELMAFRLMVCYLNTLSSHHINVFTKAM